MDGDPNKGFRIGGIEASREPELKLKWYRKFFAYFHLLFAASPKPLDICLIVTGAVAACAAGVPFPLLAILFGQVIDDLNEASCSTSSAEAVPASYQANVNSKVLLIVYLAIAQFVVMYIHLSCWSLAGARLAQRLREQYLRSILKQEPAFFDKLPAGEVSSRLDADIQTIRAGTSEKVGLCIASFSFFIVAYVVALIKQKELAGMLASLVPAYLLMSLVGSYYIEKFASRMSDTIALATAVASEALSNLLVVQAFGAEDRLRTKFAEILTDARKEGIKKAIATGLQTGSIYFIAYGANGLAFWQGSRSIADSLERDKEGTTVGATYTVIFALVDAALILSQVAPFIQNFGAATGAFRKLNLDMTRVTQLDGVSETAGIKPEIRGAVELHNVSFSYPARPEQVVLQLVSLSLPAGKHTAIVGLSGSGKSTVAGLLSRLYAPSSGSISIDGHDISELNIRHLRSYVSLVQQDPVLLDRSIFENIALGLLNSPSPEHTELRPVLVSSKLNELVEFLRSHPNIDLIEAAVSFGPHIEKIASLVVGAANQADAAGFIKRLQKGYATQAGQGGKLLSGGQRQRCALARAIVKNPRILILDEATSALDSISEQRVIESIDKLAHTRISIAHRLASIRNADNIVVMRDGKVLEQGSHQDLMDRNEAYADLVRLQALGMDKEMQGRRTDDMNGESLPASEASKSIDNLTDLKKPVVNEGEIEGEATDSGSINDDTEAVSSKRSRSSIVRSMSSMIRRDSIVVLVALTASIVVGSAYSAEAVIFGNTVSHLNTCRSVDSIRSSGKFFGLMFFVLAIIEFFANVISWAGFGLVAEKLLYHVRVGSLWSLLQQNVHWHQSAGRSPAKLLSIITRDASALGGLSGSVIGTIISIIVNLVAAITLTCIIAWKIALVCIATVPLLLAAGLMELRVLTLFEEKHESAFSTSVAVAVEALGSIKTVAALSLENEVMATYRRTLKGPRKETTRAAFHACLWLAMTYFIGTLSYALTFWWGSKQVGAGTYSQTQFLIVVMSLLVSAQLWGQMFALAPELTSARAAVGRILNLLDLGDEGVQADLRKQLQTNGSFDNDVEANASNAQALPEKLQGMAVKLQNVVFAYPSHPHVNVLADLDLDIRPGTFCALVGPSGAGKSTIIALLEKFYTPTRGTITLDGMDTTCRSDVRFRDDIALVPQDSALFEGTIHYNIGLGARSDQAISDREIEDACRLANIHDKIVALPEGYNTLCGSNGGMLSGGERQRLAIARALVRKPRLLILDESTSALDAESERLLQDGLDQARQGITVIAVAHRLNTIKKADVIFVIDGGKCVDEGTHAELFDRNDTYRQNAVHQMF